MDEGNGRSEVDWSTVAAGFQRAIRSFDLSVQPILRAFDVEGMGPTNVFFLINVGQTPKRVADLVRSQGYAGSNASYSLEMLANAGLIERSVDEQDRRIRVVWLTERGQKLLGAIQGIAAGNRDMVASALQSLEYFEAHFAGAQPVIDQTTEL